MARFPRLYIPDTAQHVVQRGNNRQACFCSDQDFAAYAHWLKEAASDHGVAIHAWVFMTNHVHLLVTPSKEKSIANMMQRLGRLYVRYFNNEYRRSGTLWEGRYKSSLVQSEYYLLQCYRYIELNPVRAAMVSDPADYRWSSYQANALGKTAEMLTQHSEYLRLGRNQAERQQKYRELFTAHADKALLTDIRKSLNRGLVLGNDDFKDQIEKNLARRVRPGVVGRPATVKNEPDRDGQQVEMQPDPNYCKGQNRSVGAHFGFLARSMKKPKNREFAVVTTNSLPTVALPVGK